MSPLKVFVSSTFIDLKEYRQQAINILNRYQCVPLAMEFFMAKPEEPTKVCEKEIKTCDLLIGIYAHRYGYIPEGQEKSITQQEYELARKLNKPCLCFIITEDFPWNPRLCEFDKLPQLNAFLNRIKTEITAVFFTTIADFESKLSTSLGNQLLEMTANSQKPEAKGQKLIPLAPTPFIAHPYPLPQNFTGREAEKSMLSNWFYNAKAPVLVLEAIGGMGKTALSWVWLHEALLEKRTELAGILWWSFYDAPFESFLPALFRYVTSREVKIDVSAYLGDLAALASILYHNHFLLVLDGFERALRGYANMSAMYIQEKGFEGADVQSHYGLQPATHKSVALLRDNWDQRQREPVHPYAARFLKALTSGQTKVLMTTRLFPTPLQDMAGVQHECLMGLSPEDTVNFFRKEGIQGNRAEMERAGAIYNFHPLMLKQLSSAIQLKRGKDIQDAFKLKLIDAEKPQKILNTSFNLLNKEEKQVAATVSVLRQAFSFETAQALLPKINADALWDILQGLQQLGFLFFDDKNQQFDFHPIMRSFLYDSLTGRDRVHEQATHYFEALPKPEKVVRLEDLTPVIELYHHLVGAGKFDEARDLYRDRLSNQIYYQLSNYNLDIELLKALLPDGEGQPPRLKKEGDQAWTLNSLANSYSLSGQPAAAVPLFLMQNKFQEKDNNTKNLAIGLGNAADDQFKIGKLSVAGAHLRKRIALCQEIKEAFSEAIGHQELGRVLAYQGHWNLREARNLPKVAAAEEELAQSTAYWKKTNNYQTLSIDSAYRSLTALLQSRLAVGQIANLSYTEALQALEFAEKTNQDNRFVTPYRDFIRAYWLLGEALIQIKHQKLNLKQAGEIHFYDEPFQQMTETLSVKAGQELLAAERCLTEALRRCRKVNLVEMEPDILLASARLLWERLRAGEGVSRSAGVEEIEVILKEAREIAVRAGYRLVLADIHLFCAEVLLETFGVLKTPKVCLLELTAREHLVKAKEFAKDVSTLEDLYQSPNPHFYDGIPEYEMLKRGMTDEERIQNGYWVAYQVAERMEGKVGREA